jgi:hypothetical protein
MLANTLIISHFPEKLIQHLRGGNVEMVFGGIPFELPVPGN